MIYLFPVNKERDSPVNLTNFTFRKMTIFEPPDEIVRSAGPVKNRPLDGVVKKTPTPSSAAKVKKPAAQKKSPAVVERPQYRHRPAGPMVKKRELVLLLICEICFI